MAVAARTAPHFERYVDFLNARNPDLVHEHFTRRVKFEDSAWPTVMHGPAEIREMLESRWRAFPDLRFTIREGPYVSEDGSSLAVKMRLTGTMRGRLVPPGFDPTNSKIKLDVAGFYDFEGEKVSRGRVILDAAFLAQQIDAMPGPGLAQDLGVIFQRLTALRIRHLGH